jgi:hypothetical protein
MRVAERTAEPPSSSVGVAASVYMHDLHRAGVSADVREDWQAFMASAFFERFFGLA